jgi:hypothetical protein
VRDLTGQQTNTPSLMPAPPPLHVLNPPLASAIDSWMARRGRAPPPRLSPADRARADAVFALMDADGSGAVDGGELGDALEVWRGCVCVREAEAEKERERERDGGARGKVGAGKEKEGGARVVGSRANPPTTPSPLSPSHPIHPRVNKKKKPK